jgi:hypothetical protein
VRQKATRKFKDKPEKLSAFRRGLKDAIYDGGGEEGVKKVCKKYGIDPEPGRAGRPKKNP